MPKIRLHSVQVLICSEAERPLKFRCLHTRGGGALPYQEVGGLGPQIKFGGKIWGKVRPSSRNKRKNLGSSVTTRRKIWGKNPDVGVKSEIQMAKFGVFVTYIFGGKIWGSNNNFRGKFGAKPPDLLIWKNPPGPTQWIHERWAPSKMCDEQSNLVTWDEGSWQSKMNKQNPVQGYL